MEKRDYITLEKQIKDVMGNVILRGHIIAYSKSGQGERLLNIGVVTDIRPHGRRYNLHLVGKHEWGNQHRVDGGEDGSVVILNDPLYSLDSKHIQEFLEEIEGRIGKKAGEIYKRFTYKSYRSGKEILVEKRVKETQIIPDGYEFGEPWEDEQTISIKAKR